jgi:apolipoprotein N-acyltransferase
MICFDAIFPEINLAYAEQDPEFLVNPTNDAWYGYSSGPYQFLTMVRMRAIEAGKAVARPAYSGVTAIVLPTGEVAPGAIEVGPVDSDLAPDPDEPPKLLLGELPRLHGRTLYTSIGDLFAYACASFALLCLGAALRSAPRETLEKR